MQHTKGSWVADHEIVIHKDSGKEICICSTGDTINNIGEEQEALANAKLCAGSPEMIETLLLVKEYLERTQKQWLDIYETVNNAINRATL